MTHQIVLRYAEKYQILTGVSFVVKFIIELIVCILLAKIVYDCLRKVKINIVSKSKAVLI